MKSIVGIICVFVAITFISCEKVENSQQYPEGAIWTSQTIKYELPPEGFFTMLIWGNAATIKPVIQEEEALFYIDFWRVIEHRTDKDTIIYENFYNDIVPHSLTKNEGGLFCRFPSWFDSSCNNKYDLPTNMDVVNGNLVIDAAKEPNKICHWWTPRKSCNSAAYYSVEISIKVVGQVAVQFGLDYWRDFNCQSNGFDPKCLISNNCEAWISDWIYDTEGKYITLTLPKRE